MEATLPFLSFLTVLLSFPLHSPFSSAQIMQGIFLSSFSLLNFNPFLLHNLYIRCKWCLVLLVILVLCSLPTLLFSSLCCALCCSSVVSFIIFVKKIMSFRCILQIPGSKISFLPSCFRGGIVIIEAFVKCIHKQCNGLQKKLRSKPKWF